MADEGPITEADRRRVGLESEPGLVTVEAGAVERFCAAVGLTDPIYTDPEAARAAGLPERPVPPTFWCAMMPTGSAPPLPEFPGLRRVLSGGTEFEYHGRAFVGDQLICVARLADLYEKRGHSGPLVFSVVEHEWRDRAGRLVTRGRMTLIHS